MPEQRICLYFCTVCEVVRVALKKLAPGDTHIDLRCPICRKETPHRPVALNFVTEEFVTRL